MNQFHDSMDRAAQHDLAWVNEDLKKLKEIIDSYKKKTSKKDQLSIT